MPKKTPYRDRNDSVAPLFVFLFLLAAVVVVGLAAQSRWNPINPQQQTIIPKTSPATRTD
jgi:hypothetical protein